MRRLEPNIYSRGPYQYQVKVRLGRAWLTATFETIAQARAWRDSKRYRRHVDPDAQAVLAARRRSTQVSLGELLTRYRDEISPSKVMPQAERYRLGRLIDSDLGRLPAASVSGEDLQAFLDALRAGRITGRSSSPQNGRKYTALVSHCYSIARKRWRLELRNPVAQIEQPRPGDGRTRRVSDQEFAALLAELRGSRNPDLSPLAQLALATGARMGELLALEWRHVDLRRRALTFEGGRDARGRLERRTVPFDFVDRSPGRVERILRALRRGKTDPRGRIFRSTQSAIEQAWRRARVRAGLPDVNFHDLRHEAASRLYESGAWADMEIMQGLGHRSLATTARYAHLRLRRRR